MFTRGLKLSAPIAGTLLLASLCFAPAASAASQSSDRQVRATQSELVVKVDHRRGGGRPGGWQKGRGWGYRGLAPNQIRRSLRHRGFHRIDILDRRGPVYIVRAVGWRGMPRQLVVDARTAQIVRNQPAGFHMYWQYRW